MCIRGRVLDEIGGLAAEYGARVVVVDSVTPILKAVRDNVRSRSVLQEFFATLPMILNGIVVLLAEIPIIEENIELGDIEFVADTILLLTHRVEKNRLVREIQVRKARGSPLTIARVPFTITERGLRVWTPPSLETIPPLTKSRKYKLPCEILRKNVGQLLGGMSVYISYPVDARPYHIMPILLGISLLNNARTLVITYTYSRSQIVGLLLEAIEKWDPSSKEVTSRIRSHLEKLFVIKAFNPSAYSIEELYSQELNLISSLKPNITIFFGTDTLVKNGVGDFVDLLRNQTFFLKSMGILVFRLGSNLSKSVYEVNTQLSDIVVRLAYNKNASFELNPEITMYVWVSGNDPFIINQGQLNKCRIETLTEIKKKFKKEGS
ncbi:MAG: hypothetical protein GSR79_06865, partial [Desulfurococcales archaeon]|nr:hypothetical protein [Desulfurococcales archaeon]